MHRGLKPEFSTREEAAASSLGDLDQAVKGKYHDTVKGHTALRALTCSFDKRNSLT
jgi:hypothetical protein